MYPTGVNATPNPGFKCPPEERCSALARRPNTTTPHKKAGNDMFTILVIPPGRCVGRCESSTRAFTVRMAKTSEIDAFVVEFNTFLYKVSPKKKHSTWDEFTSFIAHKF